MKITSTFALITLLFFAAESFAKRIPAPDVAPVVHAGVRYVAPNDDGRREYIEAWNVATTNKVWELTIRRNFINPLLEEDVQWAYINRLQMTNGVLIVSDERGRSYAVDLKKRSAEKVGK